MDQDRFKRQPASSWQARSRTRAVDSVRRVPVAPSPQITPSVRPTTVAAQPRIAPEAVKPPETPVQAPIEPVSRSHRHKRPTLGIGLAIGIIAGLVVLSAGIYATFLYQPSFGKPAIASAHSSAALRVVKPGDMTFIPLAPTSKPALGKVGTGGAYDKQRGTYGFIDTLEGQSIAVSQQAIPSDSGLAQQAVNDITKNLSGVKASLPTKTGSAFLITDPSTNTQSALFLSGQILVYIQGATQHAPAAWTAYLNALN